MLQALQFDTKIIDGVIKLPSEYQTYLNGSARIIVLFAPVNSEPEETEKSQNYIEYLMDNPITIKGFRPMTREEIYADR